MMREEPGAMGPKVLMRFGHGVTTKASSRGATRDTVRAGLHRTQILHD